MTDNTVITADPQVIADQCRRHAVRTAVQHLVAGAPHLALLVLIRSVKRCAHLDNRPLAADRVRDRTQALLAQWGPTDQAVPDLVVTPQGLVWVDIRIESEEVAS